MERFHMTIDRYSEGLQQTIGRLSIYDGNRFLYACYTLELPWKDNAVNISSIPKGEYTCSPYSSSNFKNVYKVNNVEGRTGILIHAGNFYFDIEGCILVGNELEDLNMDGLVDVKNSAETLNSIRDIIGGRSFKLIIV